MKLLEHNFPSAKLYSKDHIFDLYIKNEMSLPDLSQNTGLSTKTLYFVLEFFDIKCRTRSEANGGKVASEKRAATFMRKYGAPNPLCRGTSPFEKRNNTVKNRYGVDNVWKVSNVKQKITETHLKRYGSKRVVKIGAHRINKFEQAIASVLIDLGIPYQYSVTVCGRQFDFLICENVLLECNGSFWHANPNKYRANDCIKFPGGAMFAKDIWERDAKKAALARAAGFNVVTVWDTEDAVSVISKALHLEL